MLTLQIDGKEVKAEEGTTVFEAAKQAGIQIPSLCYHQDMEPYGGCRLCMVEVIENGAARLHPACAFPVKNNIHVKTQTERLAKGRKIIAELLLARCPDVDLVKNLAASLGVTEARFKKGDSNCVLCGQCVRVCRNVANVGAIDFVGRGINRHPGTPFDLPSEECIGCGSCAYVCPTGAMNMEYENVLRWRQLPGPLRKCRYMRMGFISYKVCPNDFQCWNCEVDQRMEDLAKTHPIFMLKEAREKESEQVGPFEILYDRFYDRGHTWMIHLDGTVRIGIDDFTRKIIGHISDIRVPSVNTKVRPNEPLCVLFGNEKSLHLYTPFEGTIVDINSDVLDNPGLTSIAPHERGWIFVIKPKDIFKASRELLTGRSAKEWLKRDSQRFYELIEKSSNQRLPPDGPIPEDFARKVEKDIWSKIEKAFFTSHSEGSTRSST